MKYRRKPEIVEARAITNDNIVEVANWCGGVVEQCIVFNDGTSGQIDQIVTKNESGVVQVYGFAAFRSTFKPVRE